MKKLHPVITNFLFNIPSYSSLNRVWIFSTPNQACFLIKKLKKKLAFHLYPKLHDSFYNISSLDVSLILQQHFVGTKTKGRVSRRRWQENKAHQIFKKNKPILPPDTHTYLCASVGKKFFFSENFVCFVFLWPILRSSLCRTTNSLHYRIWSDYKKEANSVIFKVSHTL